MTGIATREEQVLREAADWLIRARDGGVDDDLLAWRAKSPDHERVWQATCRMWGLSGDIGPATKPVRTIARPRWRSAPSRKVAGWTLALAASFAALMLSPLPVMLQSDYRTDAGQRRTIALADGSQVTLDHDSAIAVEYEADQRRVSMLRGRAWFDVAHNSARPFTVAAADVTVRVTGTAFDVDLTGRNVAVALARGSVNAHWTGAAERQMVPGQRLTINRANHVASLLPVPASSIAAWRRDRLLADGITVQQAVDELSHSFRGHILVTSTRLGQRRITGAYDTGNPAQALSLVVQPLGGHVRAYTPWLLVVSDR